MTPNKEGVVNINGTLLTPEMLGRLKSFQEDDFLTRVESDLSEALIILMMIERGDFDLIQGSKEKLDSVISRLYGFRHEIEDLKLPQELRTYKDGE